ncbi:MAG TPA: NAD-dependent epimerase/dehydratase family protein [Patescibacteria group bacterium]|nr:NAD-dependent epimerase/dehydratase family protein [Patescibacteria group bacterium]
MTVVVTGASGHIGSNLVRLLIERGRTVRAVDVRPGPSLAGLDLEYVEADVLDSESLLRAFAGVDVVFHLAARISIAGDPDGRVWATNVMGVRNAAETALRTGVRRFVHCSSVHAFDLAAARGSAVDETSPPAIRPGLPVYDRSKAAGESELRAVVARGLDAVVVNPTGVTGPCDFEPSRMGRFFRALRQRRLPALVEGGFDWVDVRDVALALAGAADRGRTGEGYLVPGHRASTRELAVLAHEVAGVPVPRPTVPLALARAWARAASVVAAPTLSSLFTVESLHALASDPHVNGRRAELELGHRPRPLSDTIGDLYRWFDDPSDAHG